MRVVLAYDIVSNKRRGRVARRAEGFLQRVQKSVFEGEITETRLDTLRRMLRREMDLETDSARIYPVCRRCRAGTEVIGVGIYIGPREEDTVL